LNELAADEKDYIKTAVILATRALKNPIPLLLRIGPYIAILASFSIFVLINGGVVLGRLLSSVYQMRIATSNKRAR
jgi:hypothetical protein